MFRQRENLPSDPDLKQMIHNIKKIESEVTLKSPNKENSIAKEYSAPRFVNAKLIDAKSLLPRLAIDQAPKKAALAEAFVWGSGKDGRCGNGRETSEKVPKKVKAAYTFTSLSCGYHHSAAVSQEGMVLTWGRGVFGQLGHGNSENIATPMPVQSLIKTHIHQVVCGWQHTLALSSEGRVFGWGYGEDG